MLFKVSIIFFIFIIVSKSIELLFDDVLLDDEESEPLDDGNDDLFEGLDDEGDELLFGNDLAKDNIDNDEDNIE